MIKTPSGKLIKFSTACWRYRHEICSEQGCECLCHRIPRRE